MSQPTNKQRVQACEAVEDGCPPPETDGEVWTVLDALAAEECAVEALAEYRFWRSPAGRATEYADAWESGDPRF